MTQLPWLLVAVAREHLFFRPRCTILRTLRERPTPAWVVRLDGRDCVLVETGVGGASVVRTLAWLREQAPPSRALFAGFAGALHRELRVGDAIWSAAVVDPAGTRHLSTWVGDGRWRSGVLSTSDRLVSTPAEKLKLADAHQAVAVDMESSYFAAWCAEQKVPWACVRVISDDADTHVSQDVFALLEDGRVVVRRLVMSLLRRPMLARDLWHLSRATNVAARTIAEVFAACLVT
jgi:nucleoside phosphorylase